MAKIARKFMKIFGSSAGAQQIGKFGSLAAGSPVYTTDPETIQGLSNYLAGWYAAVIGNNSPAIQDVNALFYLYAYQLAYGFQSGVAEWNASTTYYIGSLASDSLGGVYYSLTDTNLNNALSDTTKWKVCAKNPLTTLGDIVVSAANGVPTRLGVGSLGQLPFANSNDTLGVSYLSTSVVKNLGLSASVSGNAMTIALKTASGSDPSTSSPVIAPFRNATATTGQYADVARTSALSITIPASATLGQVSGMDQYVWVYLINDGGVLDLAVSGVNVFGDLSLTASTQISSGATSGTVLYSGSAHSGAKPIRLIGRLLVNEATAGTWASNITEIGLMPIPQKNISDWIDDGSFTLGSSGTPPGVGAPTIQTLRHRRDGQDAIVQWTLIMNTPGSDGTGDYLLPLPSGLNANTNVVPVFNTAPATNLNYLAAAKAVLESSGFISNGSNRGMGFGLLYSATAVRYATWQDSSTFQTWSATVYGCSSAQGMSLTARIPISGWSAYGP